MEKINIIINKKRNLRDGVKFFILIIPYNRILAKISQSMI